MVLPQKTPSPPLHIGCFVINHVPQVSFQGPVRERTGESFTPLLRQLSITSSGHLPFYTFPLEYSEVATIPKMRKPFLYTPRLPICISTASVSPRVWHECEYPPLATRKEPAFVCFLS